MCIYDELGLESLTENIRRYRKMIFLYEIVKNLAPKYLQTTAYPKR